MKEFVEKLIGRLEELGWVFADYYPDGTEIHKERKKSVPYDEVINIVNQLAEEYGKDTNVTTNADKIRSMTDEELAELFAQYSCEDGDYASLLPIDDCKWGTKREVIERNLKWLKNEVMAK